MQTHSALHNSNTLRRPVLCGVLSLMLSFSAQSFADDLDHNAAQALRDSGEIVALEKILASVNQQHPGRILEVELEKHGKQLTYEIELVDNDGIVWEFEFNARNGELIKSKKDD